MSDPSIGETKSAALYGSAASISDRGIVDRITWSYLDSLYVTKTSRKIPTSQQKEAQKNEQIHENGFITKSQ